MAYKFIFELANLLPSKVLEDVTFIGLNPENQTVIIVLLRFIPAQPNVNDWAISNGAPKFFNGMKIQYINEQENTE